MRRLLAFLSAVALALPVAAQDPAPAAVPARAQPARALLVGCTEYPFLKEAGAAPGSNTIELRGPKNDVELFARALREVYGVPESAMTRLAGWPADEKARPTKDNIVRAFGKLAAESQKGEWVVVFLAGHGSQQPSASNSIDDEADGLDEIFLPSDVRPAADGSKVPNALTDDEIAQLVGAIRAKGADVWLVIDACHSGTMLRGGDYVVRGLPPGRLGVRGTSDRTASAARAESAPAAKARTDGVAAFYGAQSFGSAPEMELPQGSAGALPQGLFTYLLAREMRRVGASATYSELAQRVVAAYQAFPCYLTVPLAEGDLDRVVGGGGRVADPPLLLEIGERGLRLNQGILQGVEVGVQIDALPDETPGTAQGAPPAPLARLEVVESGLYEAQCQLRSGALPDGATSLRARIASRPVGEFQLALAVVSTADEPIAADQQPEALRALLKSESNRYRIVTDPARADWRVVVDGARFHLRAADHAGVPDVLDVEPAKLALTLGRIRKVHNLCRVCGLFPPPDDALSVWVERRARGSTKSTRLSAGDVLRPGDQVQVKLKKTGEGIYDVTVLYLDANYGIQCLFPQADRSARLEPKADKDLELTDWIGVVDDALGVENLWVLAVPRGPSDPVTSLRGIAQDPTTTRGLAEEKVARNVIEDLVQGPLTRGLAAEPAGGATATAGSVFLVPLVTAWPELGPPAWGRADPGQLAAPIAGLQGLPLAFDPGDCWEIRSSPARGARGDVLLLGTSSGPRAVLFDVTPPPVPSTQAAAQAPAAPDPATFEPEAAFLFLADGCRLALYDTRDRGAFDLALLDRDADGIAESRWTKVGAEWILQVGVTTPWLSQSHLPPSAPGTRQEEATSRFSLLVRAAPR